jgi:hypothetical protein
MNTSKTRWLTAALVGCGLAWLAGGCGGKPEAPGEPDPQLSPEAAALREKYPVRSLEDRLAYEADRAQKGPVALTPESRQRLDEAEQARGWHDLRGESLRQLHSQEVEDFVKREGFGGQRMPPQPSRHFLDLSEPPPFPLALVSYPDSALEGDPRAALPPKGNGVVGEQRLPSLEALADLHLSSGHSFLATGSFGYVAGPRRAAGFDAHKFRYDPSQSLMPVKPDGPPPPERWALRRLELVSLLKHERPQVYVSGELPKMENMKKSPTRDLDAFEAEGLKKLQAGEDLHTDATLNRIRMVGSLRARTECLDCHHGERGQLLGAFSYEILRDPPLRPKLN